MARIEFRSVTAMDPVDYTNTARIVLSSLFAKNDLAQKYETSIQVFGVLMGGQSIVGKAYFSITVDVVFISYIWIAEESRGQGEGKFLVKAIERFARFKNCERSLSSTFGGQEVKGFWQGCGYHVVGHFEGKSQELEISYFGKNL